MEYGRRNYGSGGGKCMIGLFVFGFYVVVFFGMYFIFLCLLKSFFECEGFNLFKMVIFGDESVVKVNCVVFVIFVIIVFWFWVVFINLVIFLLKLSGLFSGEVIFIYIV